MNYPWPFRCSASAESQTFKACS